MYVQPKNNTGGGASGGAGGASGADQDRGETKGWGANWGANQGEKTGTRTAEELMAEVDQIVNERQERDGFAELSKADFKKLLLEGKSNNDGNQYFIGRMADDDAWLAHARETGEFVGWPPGMHEEWILDRAYHEYGNRDRKHHDDNYRQVELFVEAMGEALAQLNAEFARLAKYATDDQLKAMRAAMAAPGSFEADQIEGSDEIAEGDRGEWLASFLHGIENDTDDMFHDVFDDFRDDDVHAVVGAAGGAALDKLRQLAKDLGVDMSKPADDWRHDASLDLAEETYRILFQANRSLSEEDADEVEEYIRQKQEELTAA